MKDIAPHAVRRPADEAVVKCLAQAINVRRIDPAAAGLEDVDNAANHPSIIDARLASRVGRQKRLKPRKLIIREPKEIANHEGPQIRANGNLYGSGL